MTTRQRLHLFDTTLRDGAQMTGVDFSLEDKRQVASLLEGEAHEERAFRGLRHDAAHGSFGRQ